MTFGSASRLVLALSLLTVPMAYMYILMPFGTIEGTSGALGMLDVNVKVPSAPTIAVPSVIGYCCTVFCAVILTVSCAAKPWPSRVNESPYIGALQHGSCIEGIV